MNAANELKGRLLLVGSFGAGALEHSYENAFRRIGYEVVRFDMGASVRKHCRLGGVGRILNKFIAVEPWISKANREMVLLAQKSQPDIVIVVGQNVVRAGALAQLRSMCDVSIVYIWPDTLLYLNQQLIAALPLYDLVASYSASAVCHFRSLGARRVEWVPLGADPDMHPLTVASLPADSQLHADVSFIGQWRPEREHVLRVVLDSLRGYDIKIWGGDWGRRCRRNKGIIGAWQGRPLYGREFAKVISSSKVSLNIIDPTNYPAANMRFFEIPCAGGLQVSSPCPEMESHFKEGETIFTFRRVEELPELLQNLLANETLRKRVASVSHEAVLRDHTYVCRARQIVSLLDAIETSRTQ